MSNQLTESKIMQALDFIYDKAVNGLPMCETAEEMAASYLKDQGSLYEQANSLIRWQNTKAAGSGFLTGLGGVLVMPITLPAGMSSVIYIQIRMVAAIASMAGYDLKDDRVKSLIYVCLIGDAAKDVLKNVGIVMGSKMATNAIKNISGKTIVMINQKVGFRLLTKFGETGVINLGKAVPIIAGLIGGTMDSMATNTIGNVARDIFIVKY